MGLAPMQPDQAVIDRLSLDAAWERAKQCELELKTVRAMAAENHKAFVAMAERRLKLALGVRGVISRYSSSSGEPDGRMAALLEELKVLVIDS